MGMTKPSGPAEFEDKPFILLFGDAIYFAGLAHEQSTTETRSIHARAAILMTVFAVEGALNSAIYAQGLPNRLLKKVERYTCEEKVEFLTYSTGNLARLENDNSRIVEFCELVALRNYLAHPKNKKWRLHGDEMPDGGTAFRHETEHRTDKLKISYISTGWTSDVAILALQVADRFLAEIFTIICPIADKDKCRIFYSDMRGVNWSMTTHPRFADSQFVHARKAYGLKFKYLPETKSSS
jgi:hypothetical protein